MLIRGSIDSSPTGEGVCPSPAFEPVVAASSVHLVGSGVADKLVVAVAGKHVFDDGAGGYLKRVADQGALVAFSEIDRHGGMDGRGIDGIDASGVAQGSSRCVCVTREAVVVDRVDIGVVVGQRCAVKSQGPAVQCADITGSPVPDHEAPIADSGLAPVVGRTEGPVDVVFRSSDAVGIQRVLFRPVKEDAARSIGRDEPYFQIADVGVTDVDVDLDMLDIDPPGDRHLVDHPSLAAVGDGQGGGPASRKRNFVGGGGDGGPGLGQSNSRSGVHHPVPVIVAHEQAAAVPVPGAVDLPSGMLWIAVPGRISQDLLHVAPAQAGVGFKHQGHYPGDDGTTE